MNRPTLPNVGIGGRKQHGADGHARRAERHNLSRPKLIQGDARDQTEWRVAVIEQANERGDADRT